MRTDKADAPMVKYVFEDDVKLPNSYVPGSGQSSANAALEVVVPHPQAFEEEEKVPASARAKKGKSSKKRSLAQLILEHRSSHSSEGRKKASSNKIGQRSFEDDLAEEAKRRETMMKKSYNDFTFKGSNSNSGGKNSKSDDNSNKSLSPVVEVAAHARSLKQI